MQTQQNVAATNDLTDHYHWQVTCHFIDSVQFLSAANAKSPVLNINWCIALDVVYVYFLLVLSILYLLVMFVLVSSVIDDVYIVGTQIKLIISSIIKVILNHPMMTCH